MSELHRYKADYNKFTVSRLLCFIVTGEIYYEPVPDIYPMFYRKAILTLKAYVTAWTHAVRKPAT